MLDRAEIPVCHSGEFRIVLCPLRCRGAGRCPRRQFLRPAFRLGKYTRQTKVRVGSGRRRYCKKRLGGVSPYWRLSFCTELPRLGTRWQGAYSSRLRSQGNSMTTLVGSRGDRVRSNGHANAMGTTFRRFERCRLRALPPSWDGGRAIPGRNRISATCACHRARTLLNRRLVAARVHALPNSHETHYVYQAKRYRAKSALRQAGVKSPIRRTSALA